MLLRPATLTLPKPSGTGTVVGFGFDGDGDELHLVPAKLAGDTVELKVWHFSGAGTLTARLSELNAVLSYETTRAHGRAEQRIATALIDAAENGSDPGPAIFDALANWRLSVSNGLQVARDAARLDFFELAFGEWQAWQAYVQEYRDSVTPDQASTFDIFIRFDSSLATAAAYDIGLNLLAGCVGPGVPRSALRDVLRLATPVVMAALPIDQANDPSQRQLPTGDGLARACLDIELLTFDHAPTFARNRDNDFTAESRVKFWDGPASTTIAVRYQLRDATTGPTAPLASGTSTTGSYEDNITPAGLGTHHYELTVDLDTGGNDEVLASFFDRQTDVVEVRERLDLQARRPSDVAFGDLVGSVGPGGTVFLRIRLAGDDVAGKTITLTHDENGSVASTTTTDTNGEAFLTYGAPATAQIELVTATITEAGLESGDAVVITTIAPPAAGVTRLRNRAAVAAGCLGGPALDNLVSAPGVSTFDESLACAGAEGANSLASSFFRETLVAGKVTEVELRGLADVAPGTHPSGFATAAGRYEIEFTVDQPRRITIVGTLSTCNAAGTAELLLVSFDTGVVVRRTCVSPSFTAVLSPGRYVFTIEPSPEPRTATDGRQGRSGTTSRCRSRDEAAVTPRGRGARDAGRDRAVRAGRRQAESARAELHHTRGGGSWWLVTVRGGGLAAGTLELTVGGERVDLFDRRSDRASFRVPALGAVGEVEVVARKPGGRFAEIGLTVRFDGQTAAVADESAAVSVPVGADGGTIAVEGMSLAIPAGAVPEGTEITATPLRSLQGSPFSAPPVGLKLEPSGLVLLRPATLTLPKPSGTGTVVGFGFDGDGDELHLVPTKLAGDTVELKVWHFSGAGTLTARLSELNAVLSYETTRAHGRAEQRIATALIDAAENGSDPGPAIFDALTNWRLSVSNGLQVARDAARLDFFELAFGEWQAWQAYVQEYRDSVTPDQASTFDIFIRFDNSLATAAAYDIGLNLLAGWSAPACRARRCATCSGSRPRS